MKKEEMERILEIGVLLSEERDLNRLLEKILSCVMELARCDAGTLYLKDGDVLRFKIMRTDSQGIFLGGDGQEPDMEPVPLSRENVCAYALLENKTICIENVKDCKEYDFSGPARYDAKTGYNTRSMLVVPMHSRKGEALGVLQLINAMDADGNVCAFSPDMALVLQSVASQAAITIQNVRYMKNIKELFWSFVKVMSAAIDKRTPYNARHSEHMAACAARFVDYLNDSGRGKKYFSPEQKEELLMSVWLHDIGKVITPLEVMDKAERLLPKQKTEISHRMEVLRLRGEIDHLNGKMTAEQLDSLRSRTRETEALVEKMNTAGWIPEELLEKLKSLAEQTYTGEDGQEHSWLEPEERAMLSIRKGTLSEEERRVMEEHVSITADLLSRIPFSAEFSHVREWAGKHHEFLNGEGYPGHLKEDEIPYEVRMITILDIFDSLVADDRPYKPAKSVETAHGILEHMAWKEGKLDPELVRLFIESRCWEE